MAASPKEAEGVATTAAASPPSSPKQQHQATPTAGQSSSRHPSPSALKPVVSFVTVASSAPPAAVPESELGAAKSSTAAGGGTGGVTWEEDDEEALLLASIASYEDLLAKEKAARTASLHGVVPTDTSTRIKGHNFAIQLLRILDGAMRDINIDFAKAAGLIGHYRSSASLLADVKSDFEIKLEEYKRTALITRAQFVRIMAHRVLSATSQNSSVGASPDPLRSRSGESPPHALKPKAPASEFAWFSNITEEEVREELGYVFDAADAQNTGYISFDATMAYIVDCALQGDVGYVAEAISLYGTKGSHYLRGMDDINMGIYCPELGKVLSAGKHIGVIDVLASQTFTISYPKPEALKDAAVLVAAGGKFVVEATTAVYAIDFIPHLSAVVVAGTDRGLHVMDVATSSVLFTIPTPEPSTACVFDRSSSTVVVTNRTYAIRCYRVAAHRHSDKKFEVSHVIREHTNLVTILRALGHDGLVASAGLDGRVIVHDVKLGVVFTRFSGHSGEAISAMRYVSTFGYMASCGLRSEPKVWVVSAMASRSDCFLLADSETPHAERVTDLCDVPGSPQLLSLDRNGMIKVWDLRTFLCVQTIRADRFAMQGIKAMPSRWHTLMYDPVSGNLVALSKRRLQLFSPLKVGGTDVGRSDGLADAEAGGDTEHFEPSTDFDEAAMSQTDILRRRNAKLLDDRGKLERRAQSGGAAALKALADLERKSQAADEGLVESVATKCEKADDFPVVALAFNLDNHTVMTASDKKIRIWDAYSGKLESRFDRIPGAAIETDRITALCVNTTGRAFVVGFKSGRVAIHSYSTAALIYSLVTAGNGVEVQRLTYLHGANAFVATCDDYSKIMYDQTSYVDGTTTYWPDETKGFGVKCVSHDPLLSLLAVGTRGGEIKVFEGRRGVFSAGTTRLVATYNGITTHDIVAVQILQGFPAVAAADSVGQVHLVTIPPHAFAGRCFGRLTLRQRLVTRFAWYPQRRLLYVGCDTGTLLAVELIPALRSVNSLEACGSWETMVTTAGRSGAQPRWVEELVPRRAIQAHGDVVSDLLMIPGAGIILTSSTDRAVLAWTIGLFLRGEFDNASTFGRYIATFARPVHKRITGVHGAGHADSVAPVGDVAAAVAKAFRTKPSEDDWDTIPQSFGAEGDEEPDTAGGVGANGGVLPPTALQPLTPPSGPTSPSKSAGLPHVPGGAAVSLEMSLLSNSSFQGPPSLPSPTAAGAGASLHSHPGASSMMLVATGGGGGAGGSTHPSTKSVPRAMPRRVVERVLRLTNERTMAPSAVVESAADEEAAMLYRDRLMAFISPDVQAAQESLKDPDELALLERRTVARSAKRAKALLITEHQGQINGALPGELPSTIKRHALPAIAGAGSTSRPQTSMSGTGANAPPAQANPTTSTAAEAALAPLLSANSCGVDFHTVFAVGPSDPIKRIPKTFVVETDETAGAGGGLHFVVTQNRPNPPNAKDQRDFEIRRIMDAEDAQREAAEETRRLQETLALMAETNESDNQLHLATSGSFAHPHHHGTTSGPVSPTAGQHHRGDGLHHHPPSLHHHSSDHRETLDWGGDGNNVTTLPAVNKPGKHSRNRSVADSPSLYVSTPTLAASMDHLSPSTAAALRQRVQRTHERERATLTKERRLLPAELIKLRKSGGGAATPSAVRGSNGGHHQLFNSTNAIIATMSTTPTLQRSHTAPLVGGLLPPPTPGDYSRGAASLGASMQSLRPATVADSRLTQHGRESQLALPTTADPSLEDTLPAATLARLRDPDPEQPLQVALLPGSRAPLRDVDPMQRMDVSEVHRTPPIATPGGSSAGGKLRRGPVQRQRQQQEAPKVFTQPVSFTSFGVRHIPLTTDSLAPPFGALRRAGPSTPLTDVRPATTPAAPLSSLAACAEGPGSPCAVSAKERDLIERAPVWQRSHRV